MPRVMKKPAARLAVGPEIVAEQAAPIADAAAPLPAHLEAAPVEPEGSVEAAGAAEAPPKKPRQKPAEGTQQWAEALSM